MRDAVVAINIINSTAVNPVNRDSLLQLLNRSTVIHHTLAIIHTPCQVPGSLQRGSAVRYAVHMSNVESCGWIRCYSIEPPVQSRDVKKHIPGIPGVVYDRILL